MERKIKYHKAFWHDCLFLYKLRNEPETYKYFRNNFPIQFLEHLKWFIKLMIGRSGKYLFVIKLNNERVGQIRFDKIGKNSAEISISILKLYKKKGVMSSIFFNVSRDYLINNPPIKKLYAYINFNNIASIMFFEKMEFKKIGKKGSEIVYLKNREEIINLLK